MRTLKIMAVVAIAVAALTACNTVHGFGADVQGVGKAIQGIGAKPAAAPAAAGAAHK